MKPINILIIIILILLNIKCFSQEITCNEILPKFELLDYNLLRKDTASIKELLHEKLSFGHSNGWVETKESLLKSLPTSKVKYIRFSPHGKVNATFINDKIVTLKREQTVAGEYEGEPFEVDLKIMEVWIYEDDRWQLLARQSVEVNFDE